MNLDPAPRLNKFPFILTAVGCLTVVILIAVFAENRFAPLYFLTAVGFLVASITAVMIPVITDYAADQAESSQALREQLESQITRLHHAGESLARAAAQIKAVEEAVHKTAREAETLPYRMQEKLAEFNEALAQQENEQRDALEQELNELRAAHTEQLQTAAERIQKTVAELHALEKSARAQLADASAALGKLQATAAAAGAKVTDGIASAAAQAEARLAAFIARLDDKLATAASAPVVPEPPPPPVTSAAKEPAMEPSPVEIEPAPIVEPPAPPAEEAPAAAPATEPAATATPAETPPAAEPPKPKKPRAPRKPKTEEPPAPVEAPAAAAPDPIPALDLPAEEPVAPAEVPEPGDDTSPKPESSASSDGATRLLATAYIGIGNKLFIRGDGPGLSWDTGLPMQFVSIGKWGWFTHEAAGPIRCKLYKNDQTPALSGEITLDPGKHTEVTALF